MIKFCLCKLCSYTRDANVDKWILFCPQNWDVKILKTLSKVSKPCNRRIDVDAQLWMGSSIFISLSLFMRNDAMMQYMCNDDLLDTGRDRRPCWSWTFATRLSSPTRHLTVWSRFGRCGRKFATRWSRRSHCFSILFLLPHC